MEKYDYRKALREDIINYLNENVNLSDYESEEEAYEALYDDMFVDDSITGNASGSYYCNAWKAEESLCHNLDLLNEANEEFGGDADILKRGAEVCDVTIRCYLLCEVLHDILEEHNFNA